jgi:hypothetical protein
MMKGDNRILGLLLLVSLSMCAMADENATSVISNISVLSNTWLNDYVSGYVLLVNQSANMTFEAVPCKVTAFENATHRFVKTWDTSCRNGEPYLDDDGNWVVISQTCKISDSQGYYYFKGEVLESDGFETGEYYLLQFTCVGESASSTFYVDVPKPQDVNKWFVFARRYLGIIVLWVIVIIFILIVIYLIRRGVLKFD